MESRRTKNRVEESKIVSDPSAVRVQISQESLGYCKEHAIEQQKYAEYNELGGYGVDVIGVRIVGIKGEIAVSQWLQEQSFTVAENFWYFDDVPESDISIELNCQPKKHVNVEVKTTKPHTWNAYKRTILPYQLKKYVKRKALIVWTTTTPSERDPNVELKGWNTADEVQRLGIINSSGNVWLKDDSQMRKMDTFCSYIQSISS